MVHCYCFCSMCLDSTHNNNWRAKRAYIEFWPIFIFCRIELIFGRLTCFDMKSIFPQLFRSICTSFSRNNVCKKVQLTSGDLLFNEKQKKPFVSLSFISHIITVIRYCCFVSASDWGVERAWWEFVLLWHRFETRSADFFFFFFICFSTYFKIKTFKENRQSKRLKVIV